VLYIVVKIKLQHWVLCNNAFFNVRNLLYFVWYLCSLHVILENYTNLSLYVLLCVLANKKKQNLFFKTLNIIALIIIVLIWTNKLFVIWA
jgi:hypothetical protein